MSDEDLRAFERSAAVGDGQAVLRLLSALRRTNRHEGALRSLASGRAHRELLAEILRPRIEEILAETGPDPVGYRALVARFSVLPLCVDGGGGFALRADGQIVMFLWDEPDVEPGLCTDERLRNTAIFQGSLLYPELGPLVPSRPTSASTCDRCGGTGDMGMGKGFVCFCGGLGWVPETPGPRSKEGQCSQS